tara:strand:+ start:123 stop:812 length:690 start_codon:yes stop_codon:yes gene_type:complete
MFDVLRACKDSRGRDIANACFQQFTTGPFRLGSDIEKRRKELEESSGVFVELASGVKPSHTIGEHAKRASKNQSACIFLYHLVNNLQPKSVIEMGTAVGISGAYLSLALKGNATLTTLEANPHSAAAARETFRVLKLNNTKVVEGWFDDTLVTTMQEIKPVDFMFIDGHKDGAALTKYFESASPFLSASAIVVFDDIDWSKDMQRAWRLIEKQPAAFTLDFGTLGIWAR